MCPENITDELLFERQRLLSSVLLSSKPTEVGTVRFLGSCSSGAKEIIAQAKNILTLINSYYGKGWPSIDEWQHLLPTEFIKQFRTERTAQEIEYLKAEYQKRLADSSYKIATQDQWTLSDWLYWFEDENREWFWWGAYPSEDQPQSNQNFIVVVKILGWPFPWAALKKLFEACGATNLEEE